MLAIQIEPITKQSRDAHREQVKQWIRDLEAVRITLYKIATMTHRQFNTVKNWRESVRIEAVDWLLLKAMHDEYCKDLTAPITQPYD